VSSKLLPTRVSIEVNVSPAASPTVPPVAIFAETADPALKNEAESLPPPPIRSSAPAPPTRVLSPPSPVSVSAKADPMIPLLVILVMMLSMVPKDLI